MRRGPDFVGAFSLGLSLLIFRKHSPRFKPLTMFGEFLID